VQNVPFARTHIQSSQWLSSKTGMRVTIVHSPGPKVSGFFAVATETLDDSGAPHTLEHLCFMGSKNYAYKGLLDKVATQNYSTTNAWTATDQTVYTMDTAGWDGFAQTLPLYLEHVLLPTLTDAACYTEVHHIDPTGADAGVVYCEMQDVENRSSELMNLRAKRLLFPPNNGLRYETGGMPQHLRVLTADRIRQFHRQMYTPRNLSVIVVGDVQPEDLLPVLERIELSILDHVPAPDSPFKRPWVDSERAPPLDRSITERVHFPEEDESMGEISIAMFGPDFTDVVSRYASDLLFVYLAGSPATILENVLVEKEHLASAVYYMDETQPTILNWFSLTGVKTENLDLVERRFFELLREAAEKPLDMDYMRDCIGRKIRKLKRAAETSPQMFATIAI